MQMQRYDIHIDKVLGEGRMGNRKTNTYLYTYLFSMVGYLLFDWSNLFMCFKLLILIGLTYFGLPSA